MSNNQHWDPENWFFTVCDDHGVESQCEVLFTFEDTESKNNYIVYTDHTTDEEGHVRVYANQLDPECMDSNLLPITDDRIWDVIENILNQFRED